MVYWADNPTISGITDLPWNLFWGWNGLYPGAVPGGQLSLDLACPRPPWLQKVSFTGQRAIGPNTSFTGQIMFPFSTVSSIEGPQWHVYTLFMEFVQLQLTFFHNIQCGP